MQKSSTNVSKQIAELNMKDMSTRRKKIKSLIQQTSGRNSMNISLDARYNSSTYGSRSKCGQNASQAIMTAITQDGDEHEIIDLFIQNKLCWNGAWLRSQGYDVKCPGHLECTATTEKNLPLSEFVMGDKIGQQLSLDEILIHHACTDGDSRSAEGLNKAMTVQNPIWKVLRQSDTTHLGLSIYKRTLKCEFSRDFFPNHCSTKEKRNDLQRVFSEDVKTRCHITFNNLYEENEGDLYKMSLKLNEIVKMLVKCYNGNHTLCLRKGRLINCGGGKFNNWFKKSAYFNTLPFKVTSFMMTKSDKNLLKEILKMKLGFQNIELMKFNLNTNFNEAIHRGYSTSLPRNVKYSRNFVGRVHSAAHRLNYGIGESLHLKLEKVGAPVQKGGKVAASINQLQSHSQYQRQYAKSKLAKKSRALKRCVQRGEYYQIKRNKTAKDLYIKGILDNPPTVKTRQRCRRQDHTYSEFDWS